MITADRLRELLHYDPETGIFTWRVDRRRARCGDVAGTEAKAGYISITIDYQAYRASRLAWLYMTGWWPKGLMDHVNRDVSDNRWCNLREATPTQNIANSIARSASKLKGAYRNTQTGRWYSQIRIGGKSGKMVHLGMCATKEEANKLYLAEAKKVFGEFARGQ